MGNHVLHHRVRLNFTRYIQPKETDVLSVPLTADPPSHVRLIDSQLDQLNLSNLNIAVQHDATKSKAHDPEWARVVQLQLAIKSLSTASTSRVLLHVTTIQDLLKQAQRTGPPVPASTAEIIGKTSLQTQELEWLLVGKATAQTYGLILNVLLEQIIPLSREIGYWDEVLGSYAYTGLYTLQNTPQILWRWVRDVYRDARQRLQSTPDARVSQYSCSISDRWSHFYGLVRECLHERSLNNMQSKILSPLTMSRTEVRRKQSHLKRLREMSASGLGLLMDEGLNLDMEDEVFTTSKSQTPEDSEEWRNIVSKSIALMETVLRNVTVLELGPNEFEDTVFTTLDDDPDIMQYGVHDQQPSETARLATRLEQLLCKHLPSHAAATEKILNEHGRPSLVTRYWFPALVLFLSSGTLLRVGFNRRARIITWIQDFVATTRDFWNNWVMEPSKKVLGTIRHDQDSELALMSKGSLEGDRASLERMVVDFAKDNPPSGVALSDVEIAHVRAKVKEGDLTAVLRAYEKDLRKPFVGTIRGDLIRALLIQIQKTKVDVEVAISGIDALLKSQELVFG